MKKIYTAILAFLALTIVSCEKNEGLLIPQPFSDFAYTITDGYTGNAAGDTNFVESPTIASMMHMSRGALSHEWSISEGCHFLSKDFDKDTKDYTPFIKKGSTSKDAIAFVLFEKAGLHKVTLRAFFADSIPAYTPVELETYTCFWNKDKRAYEMKIELDFKVMQDVNMAFDVFGTDLTTLLASVSIDQTGNEDSKNWPSVEIQEGDSITVKFTEIIGDPVKVEFFNTEAGIKVANDTTTFNRSIVFPKAGEFAAGTVLLTRQVVNGNSMPISTKEKTLPLNVIVKTKDDSTSPEPDVLP